MLSKLEAVMGNAILKLHTSGLQRKCLTILHLWFQRKSGYILNIRDIWMNDCLIFRWQCILQEQVETAKCI